MKRNGATIRAMPASRIPRTHIPHETPRMIAAIYMQAHIRHNSLGGYCPIISKRKLALITSHWAVVNAQLIIGAKTR